MKAAVKHIWDFPSAAILVIILVTVSERLYATDWALGLAVAVILAVSGILLGLALGASKFRRAGVFGLTFGYSIILIPLVLGWRLYQQTPWLERMISLAGRIGYALFLFISSKPVPDTALFVTFSGLGFWTISLLSGFALTRRGDFVGAVAPAGIVLFIIQFYDSRIGDRVVILAIFAFLSLILLGRLTYIRKRIFWKEHHVSFSAESWTDLNLALPVAALVLILVAWLTPATGHPMVAAKEVWQAVTRPLDKLRQNLSNAISGLKRSDQGAIVEFYGSTLILGQNASSGTNTYLRIRVPLTGRADRYYWRVRTYDQYQNNQWQSINALTEPFLPEQPSIPLANIHGYSSEFTFSTPRVNLGVLVTPAHPIWISRPSIMSFSPATGNDVDPLMFSADPPILIGEQYVVHANIYNPTVVQLQQAGVDYPAWVHDHYLQLPANLSPLITSLAQRLTNPSQTPYEKAIAITEYLRGAITFSTTVEIPPNGIDPLVWFLFDTKTGFCNYYATAEVILLRIAGVPARMVVGFAQGEFEPPDKYTVLEKDAHAWPEVYFPGIGWVEFEPTSGQPVLNRLPGDTTTTEQPTTLTPIPGTDNSNQPVNPIDENAGRSRSGPQPNSLLRLILFFGLLIVIMVLVILAYTSGLLDKILLRAVQVFRKPLPVMIMDGFTTLALTPPHWLRNWAFVSNMTAIERCFGVVYQSLRSLGARPLIAQTPAESAENLIKYLPGVEKETLILLKEFQQALFSRKHSDLFIARQAGKIIRRQALEAAIRQRWDAVKMDILKVVSRQPK